MILKSRNGAVFCFHPSATRSSSAAAKIISEAAVKAGAPEGLLSWFEEPASRAQIAAVMNHADVDLIWATGGAGMISAAKATGKPSILGGPGNCPALIDETADIGRAVSDILLSKTFDHGMICGAEQSVVVVDAVYEHVVAEFKLRGAQFLTKDETALLRDTMGSGGVAGHINKALVGKSPQIIGELSGFVVAPDVRALVAEATVDDTLNPKEEPLAWEKLSPILALFRAPSFKEALKLSAVLVDYGGKGHVGSLHTSSGKDSDRVDEYLKAVKVGFLLLNQPSALGTIGDVFNFNLIPRLSIPSGSGFTDVGIERLQRHRPVAERSQHARWLHLPPRIFFEAGCTASALSRLSKLTPRRTPKVWRVMLLSDHMIESAGYVARVASMITAATTDTVIIESFLDIEPDPSFPTVLRGLECARGFQPDTIVALGGGSVMDAAKVQVDKMDAAF